MWRSVPHQPAIHSDQVFESVTVTFLRLGFFTHGTMLTIGAVEILLVKSTLANPTRVRFSPVGCLRFGWRGLLLDPAKGAAS